ncbi:MAG: hypothetical protein ACRCVT_03250 [Leadbetterella sp.]
MKKLCFLALFQAIIGISFGQTTTINPKTVQVPRYTNLAAIQSANPSPLPGSLVFNNETNSFWSFGSSWTNLAASTAAGWSVSSGNNIYNTQLGRVGIGTSNPTSTLDVNGVMSLKTKVFITANETVNVDETASIWIIAAPVVLNLPDPTTCQGRCYMLINRRPTGQPINNRVVKSITNTDLTVVDNTEMWQIVSDGTNWFKID